jgi:fumarate hydratase, class II
MSNYRIEKDSLGEVKVPADELYGAQTQRALDNFKFSNRTLAEPFIRALIYIKRCAAEVNAQLGELENTTADAIVTACETLLEESNLVRHFPIDVYQTGSGTSTNMNANEVIARLASNSSGLDIHPNDHVNHGQSSNDVIPTAISVSAAIEIQQHLLPAFTHLRQTITNKAASEESAYAKPIVKTGRTHLMDAVPVTLSQTMGGWAAQLQQNIDTLNLSEPHRHKLAQGGTAVGTGLNSHPQFAKHFCQQLSQKLGLSFTSADNFFSAIASQDSSVALSGQLKTCAVSLMKIANDLRWMNSGPLAGLGEISLQALQPGSSIMPGKVNPVIPEAVAMASAQVMGNDTAISIGCQAGNFELNVMLPMIASNLLESIQLLGNSATQLADRAVATLTINHSTIENSLRLNPILVTALNPIIGYAKAADIAKKAYASRRPIIEVAEEETNLDRATLEELLNPERLTRPHQD